MYYTYFENHILCRDEVFGKVYVNYVLETSESNTTGWEESYMCSTLISTKTKIGFYVF